MKKAKFLLLLLPFFLISCGAQKPNQSHTSTQELFPAKISYIDHTVEELVEGEEEEEIEEERPFHAVVDYAKNFLGTSYRYGGTTGDGMDCSGLVFTSFLSQEITLPRSSRDMSLLGERLNLDEVSIGDLLFFETNKRKKVINHVGLIVELAANTILFIHSTSSRGVIISRMDEDYWKEHFVMARRIQ